MSTNVKHLSDYKAPNYLIKTTTLDFIINSNQNVIVTNTSTYYKNKDSTTFINSTKIDGNCELNYITKDGITLNSTQYQKIDNGLILENLPNEFTLTVQTTINPLTNKSYMGLFESHGTLVTQCEPEGFRSITYYLDHPDVLAKFTTTITADNDQYPILLSNGNKVEEKLLENNKKFVKWVDPFNKPGYLFALVAGNLGLFAGTYTTKSGRNVKLEIYTESHNLTRCAHALESLKRSMKWDEERFNLEYDLDIYMIVASSNFNMGAMENKGLNVFNTKYMLADIDTATDIDFINVEAVIGHEYFHNWTGNRVTCRDWFQLSLKEGLTVFRDHEFTSDLHNRSVYRIESVSRLKQSQFTEDNGPLAHPVRPESYLEINNFYTSTIYEKGSEVVRMYQTILGKKGFNKGFELYIKRNDGSAATIEDFYSAMVDANPEINLDGFMLWYSQAGTPNVQVKSIYNSNSKEYTLHITQHTPDTPAQTNKKPMLIPINFGLIDKNGYEIDNLILKNGVYVKHSEGLVLLLTDTENTFTFSNINSHPIPSILRGFSAPVNLEYNYSAEDLIFLANYDSDEFNRHQALKLIMIEEIKRIYSSIINKQDIDKTAPQIIDVLRKILTNENLDSEFRGLALQTPTFGEILSGMVGAHPNTLSAAILHFQQELGVELFDSLMETYNLNLTTKYKFEDLGRRSLKNISLFYILKALSTKAMSQNSLQLIETLVLGQYYNSDNMTDTVAAITSINNFNLDTREALLQDFYNKWHKNELVMDKYFLFQALSSNINVSKLNQLMVDPAFIATNPNKIYALVRGFTQNQFKFHNLDGYEFIADQVINIDKFNPHVASTVARGFNSVNYLADNYKVMAKNAMQRILKQEKLSNSTLEIVSQISGAL